ncbi:MAG: TonB-dependent receptor, partial [Gemmatimonadota bacterium]|nr:TonB-dependent receptor [Gemmatimonadota bacterium]
MRSSLILCLTAALALASPTTAQEFGTVGGRVVDVDSGEPVMGVIVRVEGVSPTLTNESGVFELPTVPAGEWSITFEHVAYGTHERSITVAEEETTAIVVEISTEAIELRPFVVEAMTELERRRLTSGNSINEITALDIDQAARTGMSFGDLLQGALPGVDVRQGGAGLCVTYRAIRTGNNRGDCDGVSVILDGVPVADPAYVYSSIPLRDIQRVEVLSPSQAGVRYGMRSGQGALLIETKRGPVRRQADMSRYMTGFDWTGETEPYPWLKVFASSLLVNAAALGITQLMVNECFQTEESSLALRTSCGPLATASAGILSVALPSAGAG